MSSLLHSHLRFYSFLAQTSYIHISQNFSLLNIFCCFSKPKMVRSLPHLSSAREASYYENKFSELLRGSASELGETIRLFTGTIYKLIHLGSSGPLNELAFPCQTVLSTEEHDQPTLSPLILGCLLLSYSQNQTILITSMWNSYLISLEVPPTEKHLQYYKTLHEYFHGLIFELCYSYLPNNMGDLASNNYLATHRIQTFSRTTHIFLNFREILVSS